MSNYYNNSFLRYKKNKKIRSKIKSFLKKLMFYFDKKNIIKTKRIFFKIHSILLKSIKDKTVSKNKILKIVKKIQKKLIAPNI